MNLQQNPLCLIFHGRFAWGHLFSVLERQATRGCDEEEETCRKLLGEAS